MLPEFVQVLLILSSATEALLQILNLLSSACPSPSCFDVKLEAGRFMALISTTRSFAVLASGIMTKSHATFVTPEPLSMNTRSFP